MRIVNYLSYSKHRCHARRWTLNNKPKDETADGTEPNTNYETTASCGSVSSCYRNEGNLMKAETVSIFGKINRDLRFSLSVKNRKKKL